MFTSCQSNTSNIHADMCLFITTRVHCNTFTMKNNCILHDLVLTILPSDMMGKERFNSGRKKQGSSSSSCLLHLGLMGPTGLHQQQWALISVNNQVLCIDLCGERSRRICYSLYKVSLSRLFPTASTAWITLLTMLKTRNPFSVLVFTSSLTLL